MKIRVLVVDDHPIVRAGLKAVLALEADLETVAEAESGSEALTQAEAQRPDVVLMDLVLPDMTGIEATAELLRRHPQTRVVLLTGHFNSAHLSEALRIGARGFLLKDADQALLAGAIRAAMKGGTTVASEMLAKAFQPGARAAEGAAIGDLNARETEILRLLGQGKTNRAIATEMHLAEATVKKYVQSMLAKLGATDRTQAALIGVRLGLIQS